MHMADALLSPAVAGSMYLLSGAATGYSAVNLRKKDDLLQIPKMGVMGAFVFAGQMVNFSIPGTGSSGHLCGGMLLGAVLGPECGFLTMIAVLLIQCLMFADGGIMALGANVWNMAFWGCFLGAGILWKMIAKGNLSKKKIMAVSVLGCILTLQLGAFGVTVETLLSGVTELPFIAFLLAMQPIHLAIGLVEGLITSAVLCFIYEARPEFLWGYQGESEKKERMSLKTLMIVLAALTLLTAGGISLLASSHPDGLEWSIERLTGDTELEKTGAFYDKAGAVQEKMALMPDYQVNGISETLGTSISGVVGIMVVVVVCGLVCIVVRQKTGKITDNE